MSPSPTSLPDEPEVLWRPPADVRSTTRIGAYLAWLEGERGLRFTDYAQLWEWSVTDLDAFWGSIWDHFGVQAASPPERVLGNADGSGRGMPGARWFPGQPGQLRGPGPRARQGSTTGPSPWSRTPSRASVWS